ncbi:MAG: acsA 1 [Betaproteobacteria bacterium]|nr:acsA 1 [Betaproteobacteria bacterium]
MTRITDIRDYGGAVKGFAWDKLWELFDGTPERMNLAHECLDRHAKGAPRTAVSIKFADGRAENHSFADLSRLTGCFANWLVRRGVAKGERVAVILEPSLGFYVGLFGAVKRGAIGVPLFTLFGPEGLALRINDCKPKLILTHNDAQTLATQFPDTQVVQVNDAFWAELEKESTAFESDTSASDLAVFQYTSGTTRELPEAVKHTHRAVVTLMIAALYGVGLAPEDNYFCPSSPAWGHGLWHGTIAPLALGIHIAAYSGKFDPARIVEALLEFRIDNFAAAATVFRMVRNANLIKPGDITLPKISFTGEPIDTATAQWVQATLGSPACSMYGTTEVGVLIVNYPGFNGYAVKPGSLGKPAPGWEVAIVDQDGRVQPPDTSGEIAVKRKGAWFYVKDRGRTDADGYFYHEGRSDDVIISAGWTMSAVEIENSLMKHPAVLEAAVVGAPDAVRGQVARAYIVTRERGDAVIADIQAFMKKQLSQHEYPRQVEFVDELPKTPAGKVNRKVLRDRAASGQ